MGKIKTLFLCLSLVLVGNAIGYASPVADTGKDELIQKVSATYTSQIGVRELTGHNDGVMVEKYLATTGFAKGYAWCASFVSWSFNESGVTAIKSAWAPSWFPPDKTIFIRGKLNKSKPGKADVFGLLYTTFTPPRIGHVGFIDGEDGEYYITVEGNTNSAGSREGDGVYRKRRLKANIYKISRWV